MLLCGVTETNVIAFNSTWITPTGEMIEAFFTESVKLGQFGVQNSPIDVIDFHYVTVLTISKLSYANAGTYTCSANYSVNGSNLNFMTGTSNIEVYLSGMYIYIYQCYIIRVDFSKIGDLPRYLIIIIFYIALHQQIDVPWWPS